MSGIDLNRFGKVLCINSLSGTKIIGFNTAETTSAQVVIIPLAKPVDISKGFAISSVCIPWHSFIEINNNLSLPQSLGPAPNVLGIALNFLIIRVHEFLYFSIVFV